MQSPIADLSAVAFHRELYETLAAGGSIDDAVSQGRLAIFNRGSGDGVRDWGAPVLYLRSEDGVLFPRPAEETTAEASARRGKIFFVNLFLGALAAALGGLWLTRLKDVLPPLLLGLGGLLTLFLVGLRWLGGDELRNLLLRWIGRRSATGVLAAASVVAAALNLFAVPKPFHLVRLVPGLKLGQSLPELAKSSPDATYSVQLDSPAWTEPVRIEDLRKRSVYLGADRARLEQRIKSLDPQTVTALLSRLLADNGMAADHPVHQSHLDLRRINPMTAPSPALPAGQPLNVRVFRDKQGEEPELIADVECPGADGAERTCYIEKGDS